MINNTQWSVVVPRAEVPIIVICHNLLSDLRLLVEWLETAGHEQIILLDNTSTYPPLLDYLASSPHQVVRLPENLGHGSPWSSGLIHNLPRSLPYVVTDPDILPDPACPLDAVEYFQDLLLRHDAFDKAGFGLHLDDIPEWYPHREAVRHWESPYWENELADGVFTAHIDTTFAVCRPRTPYKVTESLRTGSPYVARHLPWYRNPAEPDDETAFFFDRRRDDIGYWNREQLPSAVVAGNNRRGQ